MDLIGVYLKESFKRPGCPVCTLIEQCEKKTIEEILYEHVNDPVVRERFAESLGLCSYHAWKIKEIAYSNPLYGGLGVAVIYRHMLSLYIKNLEKGEQIREKECYLCKSVKEKERYTVGGLADRMKELFEEYKTSEAILCKKHYDMLYLALKKKNVELAEHFKEVQIQKLKEIENCMKRFISKFDYRSKEAPTQKESLAGLLAIESLKGLPLGINFVKQKKKRSILGGILSADGD